MATTQIHYATNRRHPQRLLNWPNVRRLVGE